jgi:hypothetical protein
MLLDQARHLTPGTPLLTTRGERVTFATMTTTTDAIGRTCHVAVVDLPAGRGIIKRPQSLRVAEPTPKAAAHPETTDVREDLADAPHTITVERLTRGLARDAGRPEQAGTLAIIERHRGRFAKLCMIEADIWHETTIERVAEGCAHTYGAQYVPGPRLVCSECGDFVTGEGETATHHNGRRECLMVCPPWPHPVATPAWV